jgi:NitT/TauT family transport system substrate-binding protein
MQDRLSRMLGRLGVLAGALIALTAAPAHAQAPTLKKVKVAMASATMSPSYPYLYVAQKQGFWKEEGLDVEVLLAQGSAQVIQLLASKQADVGMLNPEPIVVARAKQNLPIKSIATVGAIFSWSTAVPPNSPIKTVADLKGKKVGVFSLASGGAFYIKARAVEAGLDPEKDITLLPTGFGAQATEALRSGAVDAILLWRAAFAALENAGVPLRYLPPAPWETNLYSYIVAANESAINGDPDTIAAILRGLAKASEFTAVAPKAATQIYWQAYPDSINVRIDRKLAFDNDTRSVRAQLYDMGLELDSLPKPPNRIWGGQSESNWAFLQDYLKRAGQIDQTQNAADFFTDRFTAPANAFDKPAVDKMAKEFKTEF